MHPENPKLLRPGDFVVFAVILLLAASTLLSAIGRTAPGKTLLVSSEGVLTRYALSEDRTVSLGSGGYSLTLVIENGQAYLADSDCPNRLCVASSAISRAGQSIVCLPAHLIITVEGGDADADVIVG